MENTDSRSKTNTTSTIRCNKYEMKIKQCNELNEHRTTFMEQQIAVRPISFSCIELEIESRRKKNTTGNLKILYEKTFRVKGC